MITPIRVRPAAIADVDDIAMYIGANSVERALRFLDAIDETYRRIGDHPRSGAICDLHDARFAELRRVPVVGHPNHLVFYIVRNRTIDVLRVLHGARDSQTLFLEETPEAER